MIVQQNEKYVATQIILKNNPKRFDKVALELKVRLWKGEALQWTQRLPSDHKRQGEEPSNVMAYRTLAPLSPQQHHL